MISVNPGANRLFTRFIANAIIDSSCPVKWDWYLGWNKITCLPVNLLSPQTKMEQTTRRCTSNSAEQHHNWAAETLSAVGFRVIRPVRLWGASSSAALCALYWARCRLLGETRGKVARDRNATRISKLSGVCHHVWTESRYVVLRACSPG